MGDAIVIGPNLRKSQLSLDRNLVEQWAKGAPGKSSIMDSRLVRRLPKLLVVLEEWVAPAWAHIYSNATDRDPGSFAVGLAASDRGGFPQWHFIKVPGEDKLTSPNQIGNGVLTGEGLETDSRPRRTGLLQSTGYGSTLIRCVWDQCIGV